MRRAAHPYNLRFQPYLNKENIMKTWLYTAALTGFTALSATAGAEGKFTVQVGGLQNGHFAERHLLSESYGFGCTGGNIAPTISWKNAPKGTKSFVLTMYDKDAPTGLGWMHWVVANIPANVSALPENQPLPQGALQTRTDGGTAGFMGACPPKGQNHRYEITVTAVDVATLPNITAEATPALVGFFTNAHALGKAKITVRQAR